METARKITVEVPQDLLEKAQRASGTVITQIVRAGLQALRIRFSEASSTDISSGSWQRAGGLRAKVLAKRRKTPLGDALIAQSSLRSFFARWPMDRLHLAGVRTK